METRPGSPSPESSPNLPDREQEIAERVRQALHLSSSMSLDEVAEQFRHSAAWRRERLGLVGEELRDGLWQATRPFLQSVWGRVRTGWAWLRKDATSESSRSEGASDGKQG